MIFSTNQKQALVTELAINSALDGGINVNKGSAKTIFLIWVLMVLLTLLCIQMIMVGFGLNRVYAQDQATQQTAMERAPSSISTGTLWSEQKDFKNVSPSTVQLVDPQLTIIQPPSNELNKSHPYKGLTREQTQDAKRNEWLTIQSNAEFNVQQNDYYSEFFIYDAYASLFDDNDEDGFYRSFNVVFDADYYGNQAHADVYAELYISASGGPWYHYFSTDVFAIYGDSETDSYEVFTTLYENYPDNYYNLLIDLYQVDSPGVVATISSDDIDTLYALPLESEDFDTYHQDEYYDDHHNDHHGSLYGLLIMILFARLIRTKLSF